MFLIIHDDRSCTPDGPFVSYAAAVAFAKEEWGCSEDDCEDNPDFWITEIENADA